MSLPQPVLSLVTLGVSDLARSIGFYEALGFRRKAKAAQGVGFFQAGASAFAVWSAEELAKDATLPVPVAAASARIALAWNCRSAAEVDAALEVARRAGANLLKAPQKTDWGGYVGYFTDPDGHLWEVAHNPHWPLRDDGRLTLPE